MSNSLLVKTVLSCMDINVFWLQGEVVLLVQMGLRHMPGDELGDRARNFMNSNKKLKYSDHLGQGKEFDLPFYPLR